VEAIEFLAGLIQKHRVAPNADDTKALGDQSSMFYGGKLAILPTGAFNVPDVRARTSNFDWDVAPLPKGKAGRFAYLGGTGMGLHSKSKYLETTWDLLKFVIGPEGQKTIVDVQLGVSPYKPLAKKEFVQLPAPPANRKVIAEAPEVAKLSPKTPKALDIDPIWREELNAIFDGKKTPKEALKTVEQKANEVLGAK
jgi:multiple sugar transport system substrate-binding protein